MSWFSDQMGQSAWATGAGTPWGAGSQKGGLWDALTTGKGTPWGATGEKGMQGFQTPTAGMLSSEVGRSNSGFGEYQRGTESGINDWFGLNPAIEKPDFEQLPNNPGRYK